MRHGELFAISSCVLLASCGSPAAPSAGGSAAPSVVSISAAAIAELQAKLSIPAAEARERLTRDALLATHLTQADAPVARYIERIALARATARQLWEEAVALGPPKDDEVAERVAARWWEFERPRMVAVQHAVVLSSTEDAEARALAERIATAVSGAKDEEEFRQAAEAVPAGRFSVRIESLPPVAPDGRALDPEKPPPRGPQQQLVPAFAEAAARLEAPNQQSGVVRTSFGYHVLRAQRIIEAKHVPLEERREVLGNDVRVARAAALQRDVLERQKREVRPQQERAALSAMEGLEMSK